jgi:DNA (cytosine-5)-methyltransferase 1
MFSIEKKKMNNYLIEDNLYLVEEYQKSIIFQPRNNSDATNKLRGIDLFCGIGGFRLAMERLGVDCVFSSDIDSFAQKTYQANFGDLPFGDITKISADEIPPFDILTGGFPCQPFSYSGLNKGFEDKTRGTLFYDILRILEYHKPKMFFLENVKGLKSHENGKTLNTIVTSLETLGYRVSWQVLNSYHFGLPQYRERWYCVGFLDSSIDFKFPLPPKNKTTLENIIDIDCSSNDKLKLSDFELRRIDYHFSIADGDRVQHDSSIYAPNTKKGKHGVYSYQKPDGSLRFHVGDFAKTQIQEAFYACVNTYAPTIIAGRTPKLWDLRRKLSVLEATRLQGFPDSFKFPVSDAQAYKQLGNSVSVPVIEAILREIMAAYTLVNSSSNSLSNF